MGKKKRPVDNAAPTAIPLFYEKKKKLDAETSLTAMIALHKYCARFKLGAPGFRQKNINPFVITVVMGDNEFGTGQHRSDREKAMEQAALVTLHLMDPDGKSISANITHSHEGELKRLTEQIANAKHDEVKSLMSARPLPGSVVMGGMSFPPPLPRLMGPGQPFMLMQPQAPQSLQAMQAMQLQSLQALPSMNGFQNQFHRPPPAPPMAQARTAAPAPLPPRPPPPPKRPMTEDGVALLWVDEAQSIEEARAALPQYAAAPYAAPPPPLPPEAAID